MAPNKFEIYIKNQLKEREIKPSNDAWDKLSKSLDVTEPRSKKRKYLWYGVAASVIGIVLLATQFDKGLNLPVETSNGFVNIKAATDKVDEKENTTIKTEFKEENGIVLVKVNQEIEPGQVVVKEVIEKEVSLFALENKPENKISIDSALGESILPYGRVDVIVLEAISAKFEDNALINIKITQVIAHVDSLEKNNVQITDSEVDALLRNAQKEILITKKLRENVRIDAMALLTDVEDELDQSLREKLFEKLKIGFLKNRTSVVKRSN